jgi:Zn-dependent metalloprotease
MKKARNGLVAFATHAGSVPDRPMLRALAAETAVHPTFALSRGAQAEVSPEAAARAYVEQALRSKTVKDFNAPSPDSDLKLINTEMVALTGTKVVKFRQRFNNVQVYGSLISVELDENNKLIGINSSMGSPENVSPVANVAPAQAVAKVGAQKDVENGAMPKEPPTLRYYYDQAAEKWRLVFLVENVKVKEPPKSVKRAALGRSFMRDAGLRMMDFVVDAHSGKVVARLPRQAHALATSGTAPRTIKVKAKDGLGNERSIGVQEGKPKILCDSELNIQTFDFEKQDLDRQRKLLPGKPIKNPPDWSPAAVSAHANASAVALFLREYLKRNNIDDRGGVMRSSIWCVCATEKGKNSGEWINAYWDPEIGQMVYGQRSDGNGGFITLAIALDVVAHEMFHGVTDHTAGLVYSGASGALNESISDIFGVIVANHGKPIKEWSWEIGAGLTDDGKPFRNMSRPSLFDQPETMSEFWELAPGTSPGDRNDYGYVHTNSGIHNKAAYNMLTAKAKGREILSPIEVAAIFYLSVTQHLSRTSDFSDSRRAALQSAQTLFRKLGEPERQRKLKAIEKAFDAVGIE